MSKKNKIPKIKKDDAIAEELLLYKFTGKETLAEVYDIFIKIMKKHGILQGTPIYNKKGKKIAENRDRFEWTLYKTLWLSCVESWLNFREWFA